MGAVCGRPIMVNVLWSYHLLVDHIRVSGTWIIVRKLIGSMGEVRRRPVPSVSSTTSNDSILSNGRPWIVSARGRHTKLRSQVGKGAGERFLGRSRCRHKSANTRKTNQLIYTTTLTYTTYTIQIPNKFNEPLRWIIRTGPRGVIQSSRIWFSSVSIRRVRRVSL